MPGIAIIGAGRIGQIHAENLYRNPLAELIYVSDISEAAASELARKCEATVASVEEIMQDACVDAVLIASSTNSHAELIELSAAAEKSIFCEKPLDLNIDTAKNSMIAAQESGVFLCLGFNRRHDPSFNKLKQQIDNKRVGEVEVISITSRDPAPPPVEYIRNSGGLFRDMMIHDFDMARWLLNEEPTEVFASGSCLIDSAIGTAGDIDTAVVILRTAGGHLCQITNSRRCSYGYDQRIEVFGSEGMLQADNPTETSVRAADGSGFESEPALPFFLERYADAYRLQLDKFLRVLQGEEISMPTGLDGLRALQLADAAQQSCENGKPVTIST